MRTPLHLKGRSVPSARADDFSGSCAGLRRLEIDTAVERFGMTSGRSRASGVFGLEYMEPVTYEEWGMTRSSFGRSRASGVFGLEYIPY